MRKYRDLAKRMSVFISCFVLLFSSFAVNASDTIYEEPIELGTDVMGTLVRETSASPLEASFHDFSYTDYPNMVGNYSGNPGGIFTVSQTFSEVPPVGSRISGSFVIDMQAKTSWQYDSLYSLSCTNIVDNDLVLSMTKEQPSIYGTGNYKYSQPITISWSLTAFKDMPEAIRLTFKVLFHFSGTGDYYSFSPGRIGVPSASVYYSPIAVSPDHLKNIDNQTRETNEKLDNLTNGFNSSVGDASADKFGDSAMEYQQAEDSLFTSATSELNEYTFFDFSSVPAVMTGITFVSSTMTGIFEAMGGLSGAGIVLSVLFAVMFTCMLLGMYKYFKGR